jgi:hypothetical protein
VSIHVEEAPYEMPRGYYVKHEHAHHGGGLTKIWETTLRFAGRVVHTVIGADKKDNERRCVEWLRAQDN